MDASKRNACSRCRGLKLRCLFDTYAGHGKCRRCYDRGSDCVFEAIAPRQRRKRTDTRVAALEKQIAGLKAAVDQYGVGDHLESGAETQAGAELGVDQRNDTLPCNNSGQVNDSGSSGYMNGPIRRSQYSAPSEQTITGFIGEDILPVNAGISLLHEFKNDVLPSYPVLELAEDHTFTSLRSSQPLLLLGMVTAASRGSDQRLFAELHPRLRSLIADAVLVRGQCSLEIIQAILVMEIWYQAPEDLRHLNFYMWIQIAGTLLRQLGLWPWTADSSKTGRNSLEQPPNLPRSHVRTAFAVYLSMSTYVPCHAVAPSGQDELTCIRVAISLRRPMTMVWTDDTRASLAAFKNSAQSARDKRLVAWVKLQLLAEDVEALRSALSSSMERDILEPNSSFDLPTIQKFERRFAEWRDDAFDVMDGTIDHPEITFSSLTAEAQIPYRFTFFTVAVNFLSLFFYRTMHVQSFRPMLKSNHPQLTIPRILYGP
jgi:hypothetical protein